MTLKRGDIWLADLSLSQGSEQSGTRPVILFQNDAITTYSNTIIAIPLTSNLRRGELPSSVIIEKEPVGLVQTSVALCHQVRVMDKNRLIRKLASLTPELLDQVEEKILFTFGY